jgi:hypothetical protein
METPFSEIVPVTSSGVMRLSLRGLMLVEPVQEFRDDGGGELPFERSGCLVVAGLVGR